MPANEDRPGADNTEATESKALNPQVDCTGLDYALEHGWPVFPCHRIVRGACSCPLGASCRSPGKHPRTKNGVKDATTDRLVIEAWNGRWPDAINWAVATGGENGPNVVDVDARKNGFGSLKEWGELPATLSASTGGGGRHLYFASGLSLGNRTGWLAGVDFKTQGGYVMLPGSNHISGGTYKWENLGAPLAAMPEALVEAIKNAPTATLPATDDVLAGVPEGKRDDILFKAACRWRRQLGDNRKAVETLALAAARACLPPFPDDQAIKCVESAFRQDHRDDDDVATEWARLTVADEEEVTTDPTWAPVNLREIIDGTRQAVSPTLFRRDDDRCLVYPGKTHSFHGESESGKSMVVQWLAVQSLVAGDAVLYLDFESDEVEVVSRLLMLGAPPQAIIDLFVYVRPEANPYKVADERDAWLALLGRPYALAVIDGVTNALGVFGYKSKENDDLSNWSRVFPDPLARRTGAAVVMVDHVTKSTDGRGRFAIGGQQKMSALSGAGYTVEVAEPLGKGMRGEVVLRVGKDRPGQVRPFSGPFRKTDRTQEAARVIFDSTAEEMTVTVKAPNLEPPANPDEVKVQKVYVLVDGIRRVFGREENGRFTENLNGLSANDLKKALRDLKVPVPNDGTLLPQALAAMEASGELERAKRPGRGGGELWRPKNEPIPN